MDEGKAVDVYLNFSKAFDMVSHSILTATGFPCSLDKKLAGPREWW